MDAPAPEATGPTSLRRGRDIWWSRAVPCGGTDAQKFLEAHGCGVWPSNIVRFLPEAVFTGPIACPAVAFAYRTWPDLEALSGLEVWPVLDDGFCPGWIRPELWGDTQGAAVICGTPGERLAIVTGGGPDALAASCRLGEAVWGIPDEAALATLVLPKLPAARKTVAITPRPPAPETVRAWAAQGREASWMDSRRFWSGVEDAA